MAFLGALIETIIKMIIVGAVAFGGIMLGKTEIEVSHARIELTLGLEANMLFSTIRVPIGKAVVIEAAAVFGYGKTCGELIAVTELIPIIARPIEESATCGIVAILTAIVQGVDIAKRVGLRTQLNTCMYGCNTHIGEGVIETLNKQTDRGGGVVAYDIHARDVAIRGVVVGTALDVDTQLGIFNRGVADNRLTTAINRDACGHARAINHSSVEVVVATRNGYIIGLILTAQTYHSLLV